MTLPLKLSSNTSDANADKSFRQPTICEQPDCQAFSGRKILLVEDNELNREIAAELLQNAGFILDFAEDGTIAVDKMRTAASGQYDLILMDIQMPKMNGYDAARQIRQLSDPAVKNIPIIAMTANAFAEDRQKALDAGMNDHITKPIDVPKLMETLYRILPS